MSNSISNQQSRSKIRVAVLYGGRSGEHEISLRSAASVVSNLDRDLYEVILVGIDKEGHWHFNDRDLISATTVLPVYKELPEVILPPHPSISTSLIELGVGKSKAIDVFFPVMHGPLCEDGSIQGLLELADVPYAGCGVLGSAICMDKEVAKRLALEAGIPVVPWVAVKAAHWAQAQERSKLLARVKNELGFPCFVKPANLGSSVGVHKVKSLGELIPAIEDALRFDQKVLVEKGIAAREIEVAVLENSEFGQPALCSIAGEIVPSHEFYSYESKYLDENGAALWIPAKLDSTQMKEVQSLALRSFNALECEGLGRVDFFLDRETNKWYLNEINTMPGFTSISMYPKMWEASGVSYSKLLTKLIDLAMARHQRKSKLVRDFHQK